MLKSLSRFVRPQAAPDRETFLIIGLGNPGREYRFNRHNAGFMAVSELAGSLGASLSRMQSRALVGTALLGGRRVVMAKPQTYMNLSGQPVSSLLRFYQVPMDNLMVVHDDLDIPFGRLRLRREGGSGGARGMADIITRLGTTDFARLRIGIGRPEGGRDAAGYVLDDFSRSEQELLPQVLASVCEALRLFILEGIESAMNRYNGPVLKE